MNTDNQLDIKSSVVDTLFHELILTYIGKLDTLSFTPTEDQWQQVLYEAGKQALLGICFSGIERLPKSQIPSMHLLATWFRKAEFIRRKNQLVTQRATEVTSLFAEGGYKSVVLKGQGVAMLYPDPELRQSGDIDLWVDGNRNDILDFMAKKGYKRKDVMLHHIEASIFNDVPVEIHTWPSFSFNPIRWRKYKQWFREQSKVQFRLMDKNVGFAHPSEEFNTVYSLMHIFRHVFHEGIGLRQLLDYYYILKSATASNRIKAMETLRWFGIEKIAGAIMYVEKEMFELDDVYLLCPPDKEYGSFLLREILIGGNFGRFDQRNQNAETSDLGHFRLTLNRIFSMLRYFPSEVLWAPVWKIWHFIWRKWNRYI